MVLLILTILQSVHCSIGYVDLPSVTAQAYPLEINGSSLDKYDLVFVAEGFTSDAAEIQLFEQKVQEAIQAIDGTPPLRRCAFNFYVVRLVSNESGADHPLESVADSCKDTPLNFQFGDPDVENTPKWVLWTWTKDSCTAAAKQATVDVDLTFVIVNDAAYGGMGIYSAQLAAASVGTSCESVLVHELGHAFGNLEDEYDTRNECYTDSEPVEPNVTKKTALVDIKWKDLIASGTPIPTTVDAAREQMFPDLPVDAAEQQIEGLVGLWEGALDYKKCVYRPQLKCMMNQCGDPFCKVCKRTLSTLVDSYCPPTAMIVLPWMDVWRIPCIPDMKVRIIVKPCPIPPFPFGEWETLAGHDLSAHDEIRIELRPLPGVESISLVDQTGRTIASGSAVSPGVVSILLTPSMLAEDFVTHRPPYCLEFSPEACPSPRVYEFSASVYVNDELIDVPSCESVRGDPSPARGGGSGF